MLSIFWIGSHDSMRAFLFLVTKRGELVTEKARNTPSWFNNALKNQDVSKDVLLHFKKHYLTPSGKEENHEEL